MKNTIQTIFLLMISATISIGRIGCTPAPAVRPEYQTDILATPSSLDTDKKQTTPRERGSRFSFAPLCMEVQ